MPSRKMERTRSRVSRILERWETGVGGPTGLLSSGGAVQPPDSRPLFLRPVGNARGDRRGNDYFGLSQLRKGEHVGGRGVRHIGARSPRPLTSPFTYSSLTPI